MMRNFHVDDGSPTGFVRLLQVWSVSDARLPFRGAGRTIEEAMNPPTRRAP